MLRIVIFFDSIMFRLPSVQNLQSPFLFPPLFFLFWIKAGTGISVGEIFQKHQFQSHSRCLPQHVAQYRRPNTLKNRIDQNQKRVAEPLVRPNYLWLPSAPSSSSSMMVCANTLLILPKFLSLNEFVLINENKLNEPCQSPFAFHALPRTNLHTLYSLHSLKFLWIIIFIGNPCSLSNWLMWYD